MRAVSSPDRPLTVIPLQQVESLLSPAAPGHVRERTDRLVPPLLVTDEDSAVLVDGTESGLCLGCLLDGLQRSRHQRHRGPGTQCAGAVDGWGAVIRLAEQLLEVPLEAEGRFPRVRVLSRDDLATTIVPVSPSERCACGKRVPDVGPSQRLAHDLGRPDGPQYRAVSLDEVARDIDGLANPFCSGVGADAVRDLEIETTAKVSGAYVSRSADSVWTCPWGGHTSRYTRSHAIGLLEGLERIAGARPPVGASTWFGTAADLPLPAYPPSAFGLKAEADLVPTRWVAATRLSDGADVVVPRDVAYYLPEGPGGGDAPGGPENAGCYRQLVQDSSNGCACGGSLAEAVLYGLLEAVERDAFLIGWYGALALDEIDPASIRDRSSRELLARMRLLGHRVRFFDSTTGTRVPTVMAVAESAATGSLCFGAGAHPDAERALASALSEVASDYMVARVRLERGRRRIESMLADFSLVRVMEDHADLFSHPDARPLASFLLDSPRDSLRDLGSLTVPGAGAGARPRDGQGAQVAQRVPRGVEEEGGQGTGVRVGEEVGVVLHDPYEGEVGEHGLDAPSSPLQPDPGHHVVGGDLAQRRGKCPFGVGVGPGPEAQRAGGGGLGHRHHGGHAGARRGVEEADPVPQQPHAGQQLAAGPVADRGGVDLIQRQGSVPADEEGVALDGLQQSVENRLGEASAARTAVGRVLDELPVAPGVLRSPRRVASSRALGEVVGDITGHNHVGSIGEPCCGDPARRDEVGLGLEAEGRRRVGR